MCVSSSYKVRNIAMRSRLTRHLVRVVLRGFKERENIEGMEFNPARSFLYIPGPQRSMATGSDKLRPGTPGKTRRKSKMV
jgi:hypothetical protein